MKKVLMVMGFALCASVAFAQTSRVSIKEDVQKEKVPVKAAKAAVDYKASIFTKANGHDTIQVFKIDNASDYTIGLITSSDRIDDTLVGNTNAHNVSGDKNKWMRVSSIADFTNRFTTIVPGLSGWLTWPDAEGADSVPHPNYITEDIDPALSPNEPNDDGFMFLSYMESGLIAGRFNTYFTLPTVQRPADAVMIEVSLTQCYRKYYDRCYIDYKANGKWWAREINVDGIDMGVNTWAANKARFVMPYKLNPEQNIELRIRAYSNRRGNAFGYFWAVDNVAVMKLTSTQFWSLNSATKIDGFYGMIPQGMEIPLTWGVSAQNLSIDNIPNAKATLNAGTTRTSLNQVLQGPSVNVIAGNFDTVFPILIDERGFYNQDYAPDHGYQSWYSDAENWENLTGHLTGDYLGRGLPVATSGKNFYSINVAGGNLSDDYDTILYYVSPEQSYNYEQTGRETGYRWGRDNGIIPSGACFQTAFTDPDESGNMYVTTQGCSAEEGAHVHQAGYGVHVRFITGNDVPEGWVFRGVEFVTATDRNADNMVGASIVPITYKEEYYYEGEDLYLQYASLPCGIDGMAFEVSNSDINSELYTNGGYITPDAGYKAINVQFLEQPELKPNSSYRFGYTLNDDAQFAIAGTRNTFRYVTDSGVLNVPFRYGVRSTDTIASLVNAAAAANDYRYVPTPGTYMEVIVNDPVGGRIYAWNIDNLPFIRPIVGPARPVDYTQIGAVCTDNTDTNGVMVTRAQDTLCGNPINVTSGSQQRITFTPMGDHSVIDSVLLDGVKLVEYDDEAGIDGYMAYPYPVLEDPDDEESEVLLNRDYWVYFMSPELLEPNGDHYFTVYSHYEEFDTPIQGIDPVAPEVSLRLAPNPATSSVKLNLKGVTGMVNCSILDMSGRVIYNANINAESEHMINVSNIPAGAYFVRVTNDTFSKIEKLIIK